MEYGLDLKDKLNFGICTGEGWTFQAQGTAAWRVMSGNI